MGFEGHSDSGRSRPLIHHVGHNENEDLEVFLRAIIPSHWSEIARRSAELVQRTECLPWADRIDDLDPVIWEQARCMLSNELITAVINRLTHSHGGCYALREFSDYVKAMVSAVLRRMNERMVIETPEQAILFALSANAEQRALAKIWMATPDGRFAVDKRLGRLPGMSFALMSITKNDTAESFMARDAFWRAMLGG